MQAYHPSSAAHSHLAVSTIPTAGMQAYYQSMTGHSFTVPISMQAYYPSTAAHTHLNIPIVPTTNSPPPSPTAADLIASLQNPENLSDEDLLERTLKAQSALLKWQNEYLDNDRDIRRATTGLFNNRNEPKARQLQDPKEYERSRDKAADDATTTHETSSRGRKLTKKTNASSSQPARQPVPKIRKPKTTIPKHPQPPKAAASNPPKPKTTISKGPQSPKVAASNPPKPKTTTLKVPQPPKATASNPTKSKTTISKAPKPKPTRSKAPQPPKQTTPIPSPPKAQPSITIPKDLLIDMNGPQPAQIIGKRTRKPRKIFVSPPTAPAPAPKARSATPSIATKKRARTAEVDDDLAPPPPTKKRRAEKETSVGPARSKGDVMREVWARRQAEGRNGRHGGAPKLVTVAKARAKEGGR